MNEIIKNFLEKETGHRIEKDDVNVIAAGILDSFSMMRLISFCEKEFGAQFDMEELSPDNFNSIASISSTVKKLKNNGNTAH